MTSEAQHCTVSGAANRFFSLYNLAAVILCLLAAVTVISSSWDDSPAIDEPEHIMAGYRYVTAQQYCLNCYHPPLVKDLIGLAVASVYPRNSPLDWNDPLPYLINHFFLGSNKSPQDLLRLARAPIIIVSLLFLWYFGVRTRREFGNLAGTIALLMLSLSPTFLAHARFACTDMSAAVCFFVCFFVFYDYLKNPGWRTLLICAGWTGAALLVKFSLMALAPLYLLLTGLWNDCTTVLYWGPLLLRLFVWLSFAGLVCCYARLPVHYSIVIASLLCLVFCLANIWRARLQRRAQAEPISSPPRLIGSEKLRKPIPGSALLLIACISTIIVWCGYAANMVHTPPEFQHSYNKYLNGGSPKYPLSILCLRTEDTIFRPLSWYLTGFQAQICQIVRGAPRPIFFQGRFSKGGNPTYFPTLLLTKEPLGFVFLVIVLAPIASCLLFKYQLEKGTSWQSEIEERFALLGSLVFIGMYLSISVFSHLNIGIRHLLPIMPFVYMVTAALLSEVTLRLRHTNNRRGFMIWSASIALGLTYGAVSSWSSWPGYLAYFNELAGGKKHGSAVAIDSNCDWGTDLERLRQYVERHHLNDIYVAYFGSISPHTYLNCTIWSRQVALPSGSWLALSRQVWVEATCLYKRAPKDPRISALLGNDMPYNVLEWLCALKPIDHAGDSILIFKCP